MIEKTMRVCWVALLTLGCFAGCAGISGEKPLKPSINTKHIPHDGQPSVEEKARRAAQRSRVTPSHYAIGSPESKKRLATVGDVKVYKTAPFQSVIYAGGLSIDADGSPRAYHPKPDDDKGFDYLRNAGEPGDWWGVATDTGKATGAPIVQTSSDPAPGFYISTTALEDPNYDRTDPRRFVNASTIPFISLPLGHDNFGGRIGDIAAVVNFANNKVCYAIVADEGPEFKLGEGSIALARALGINSSPRTGGVGSGIGYCLFPNSGTQRPQPVESINQTGSELFSKFGGVPALNQLLNQ